MRWLHARALLLVAFAYAPALDFLGTLPHECKHYPSVVRELARARIYTGPHEGHPAKGPRGDAPGGGRLILPPEQRRCRTVDGYAAHYEEARQQLKREGFFPDDARLRATHVQGNLVAAIDWARAQGPALEQRRDARALASARALESLRGCSAVVASQHMHKDTKLIAGDMNVVGLAALTDSLEWSHRELARLFVHGAPIWSPINGGAYRPVAPNMTVHEAEGCQRELMARHDEIRVAAVDRVTRAAVATPFRHSSRARPAREPTLTAAALAIEQCTRKEAGKNLLVGPFDLHGLRTHCPDGAIVMPRFAKPEMKEGGLQYRCIDDGQWTGTNGCTRPTETIANPSFVFAAVVARATTKGIRAAPVSLVAAQAALSLHITFMDLKSAFKTIPTSQRCLTVIAVWDRPVNAVQYYYHPGHPFGLTAAVINFAQYPELMTTALRELCGIASDHYVDDWMLVDPAAGGHSAQRCTERLIDAVGDGGKARGKTREPRRAPRLDDEKTKPGAPTNQGLGVRINLTTLPTNGYATFEPTAHRIEKILHEWDAAAERGTMTSAEASHLLGTCGFLLEAACARVGRAALLPLVDRQRDHSSVAFTPAMQRSRAFFHALLGGERPRLPPLRIAIAPSILPPLLVYTDAAFSWRRKRQRECESGRRQTVYVPRDDPIPEPWQFNGELGLMVHDPVDGWTRTAAGRPDEETVRYYMRRERRTYIALLEGLAALSVYYTFPRRFAGRRVMHFIDNTVAQSALVHGYARTDDLADISNGFHLMAAGLRTAAYFDYVPSKANIADLPSRGEFALPRALGADVVPMRVPGRAMLEGPLEAWIDFGEQHGADKDWPT